MHNLKKDSDSKLTTSTQGLDTYSKSRPLQTVMTNVNLFSENKTSINHEQYGSYSPPSPTYAVDPLVVKFEEGMHAAL